MRTFGVSLALCVALGLAGCGDDTTTAPTTSTMKLNLTGLEDLGANAQYEGWVMVNGQPKSTGVFTVDATGKLSKTEFMVASGDLTAATAFVLTIEPKPDTTTWPLPLVSATKKPPLSANRALPMFWVRTFNCTPWLAATKAPSLRM